MAYSIYIAATIAVQDLLSQNLLTSKSIQTFLRGLESIKSSCPGIQRSIDVISKHSSSSSSLSSTNEGENEQSTIDPLSSISTEDIFDNSTSIVPFDQLPPFPLANMSFLNLPTNDSGIESESIANPFVYLNSFPSDWSTFIDQV